jgi:hypothetical protein
MSTFISVEITFIWFKLQIHYNHQGFYRYCQSSDPPRSSPHNEYNSCNVVCAETKRNNCHIYKVKVSIDPRFYIYHTNQSSITSQEGKHFQKWWCCTFWFIHIMYCYISGIYELSWKKTVFKILVVNKSTLLIDSNNVHMKDLQKLLVIWYPNIWNSHVTMKI